MFQPIHRTGTKNDASRPSIQPASASQNSVTQMMFLQRAMGNRAFGQYIQRMDNGRGTANQSGVQEGTEASQSNKTTQEEFVQPYDFLFDELEKLKDALDEKVIGELIELKDQYDLAITNVDKLKIADKISKCALKLPQDYEGVAEIKRVLQKFPHVILGEDEKVSLNDMVQLMKEIDPKREVGLVNMEYAENTGRMGLFLGPTDPSKEDAGATVSSPGQKTFGFSGMKSNFIAHTHPRELPNQEAHDKELTIDMENAQSMEMVRTADDETYFYKHEKHLNKTSGRRNPKLSDELEKPDLFRIRHFTKLDHGFKYINAEPTETDKNEAIKRATEEAEQIWKTVVDASMRLKTEQLTREEYLNLLAIIDRGYTTLENEMLKEFEIWKDKFPTKKIEEPQKEHSEGDFYSLFD